TVTLPKVNPYSVGALIALYERAVGFYASLVNINAYHQPGVEAGKKAAAGVLKLQGRVREALSMNPQPAGQMATTLEEAADAAFHALNHLAANGSRIKATRGETAAEDIFTLI